MTASTDAASDSDTDSSPDISGGTAADQPSTDDTDSGAAPGQDAGVGPGSLAFTSFLLALLCFSPFYMLGSNLWDLINGRGLLMEFTDSDPALDRHLSFGHTTVEMINGYSVSYGTVHGMSGSARFFIGLFIIIHLLLIASCAVAFVRFIAAIHPDRRGFVDHLFTRGGHLFWLLLGQALSTFTLHMAGLAVSAGHPRDDTRGALREGRSHHCQPLGAQERSRQGHPLLHSLRHLRRPGLLGRRAAGGRPGLTAP